MATARPSARPEPARRSSRHRAPAAARGVAIVGALLALPILVLAAPRLISAFHLLPGSAALALVESGARPSEAGLHRAVEAQVTALRAMPRADTHTDTALLAMALVDGVRLPAGQEAALRAVARHHVEEGLRLAPAQMRAWLMAATLDLAAGQPDAAARALTLSFVANPHVPALGVSRWPMAMELGAKLDRPTRERANLEFLSFFRRQPDAAVSVALRLDRLAELRALTDEDAVDQERLARAVERIQYDWAGA